MFKLIRGTLFALGLGFVAMAGAPANAASVGQVEATTGGEVFSDVGTVLLSSSGMGFTDTDGDPTLTLGLTTSGGTLDGGTFTRTTFSLIPVPSLTNHLSGTFEDSEISFTGTGTLIEVLFSSLSGDDAGLYDAGLVLMSFEMFGLNLGFVTEALDGTGSTIVAGGTLTFTEVQAIPLPATGLLLLGALGGLALVRRRRTLAA